MRWNKYYENAQWHEVAEWHEKSKIFIPSSNHSWIGFQPKSKNYFSLMQNLGFFMPLCHLFLILLFTLTKIIPTNNTIKNQ